MTFETWWLLGIPILFGLGWIAARVDVRELLSESRQLPRSYFKGLNFLLNENHDKAIDAFIEVAKLDTETIELHFALGSLFRRRGEIERAIRVHQSLLNRADLPSHDHIQALYAIGNDYYKAGMFDKSEEAFKKVIGSEEYEKDAMHALIRIYEAQHDWHRSMEVVKQLRDIYGLSVPQVIHYYCELAEQSLRSNPPDLAMVNEYIAKAEKEIKSNPDSTQAGRARLLIFKSQVAALSQRPDEQREYLKQVFIQTPEYGDLVAVSLAENFEQAGFAQEGFEFLQERYSLHPSLNTFEQIIKYMRINYGSHDTYQLASSMLFDNPSLLSLNKLVGVELKYENAPNADSNDPVDYEKLQLISKSIHKQSERLNRYVCKECGFQAKNFYWQCPGCHQWETYSTKRLEEL